MQAQVEVGTADELASAPQALRDIHTRFFKHLTHAGFDKDRRKFHADVVNNTLQRVVAPKNQNHRLVPFTTRDEQVLSI